MWRVEQSRDGPVGGVQTFETLSAYKGLDLYPKNNKNPVEGLRTKGLTFRQELFDSRDVNGSEKEARVLTHRGEGSPVRNIQHFLRENPT